MLNWDRTSIVVSDMFKKLVMGVAVAIAALGVGAGAQAATVYDVSSTSVTNCGSAPHGLWTNNYYSGSCANYFDIQQGSTFTFNNDDANSANWTGSLDMTAINPFGLVATVNFTLSGFAETGAYKKEGGVAYNSATDTPDIDFFTLLSGTILIDGETFEVAPMAYNFQFGTGANAKSPIEYGGSAWLKSVGEQDQFDGHWDVNLTFTEVPGPAAAGLVGLGLIGIGLARRRRK